MIDNMALNALFLSVLAGLSSMASIFLVYVPKKYHKNALFFSTAFASGVMLFISLGELLTNGMEIFTEKYAADGVLYCVLIFIAGYALMYFTDKFLDKIYYDKTDTNNPGLRTGLIFLIALTVHNFPEGMATFAAALEDYALGINIAIAIALHNIPEGMAITSSIYFASGDRKKAFLYTLISSIAEPFGAVCAYIFLHRYMTGVVMAGIFALIAGIMVYICLEELTQHSNNTFMKNIFIFVGMCFMCYVNWL